MPLHFPMTITPIPWLSINCGGYLLQFPTSPKLVRTKEDPIQLAILEECAIRGDLSNLMLGTDALGKTPWVINQRTLSVALELWNNKGMDVSTLKPIHPYVEPEFVPREQFATQAEYVEFVRNVKTAKEDKANSHSSQCDTNYKLEIARQVERCLPFYCLLVCLSNLLLSALGGLSGQSLSHSTKSMPRLWRPVPRTLVLCRGQAIGPPWPLLAQASDGQHVWLRQVDMNLLIMMISFRYSRDERVKWTDAHLGDIRKCVRDPIKETWWHSAEEPWQFLAVCIELVAALDTPDPSTYHSNIPVQQDGSCNGLQHYAALGGDVQGAKQVNLSPSDSPQDVYAAVARLVEARISRDAEAGNPMAMALSGRITRKIIKQPVMTKVYGVTRYGARLQILARLKEFNTLPAAQLDAGATYLTGHVMATLKSLFGRAQAIQDWLTTTARDIGRSVPRAFARGVRIQGGLEDPCPDDRVYYATPLTVSTGNKGTEEDNSHPHRSQQTRRRLCPQISLPPNIHHLDNPTWFPNLPALPRIRDTRHKDLPAKLCLHTSHAHGLHSRQ